MSSVDRGGGAWPRKIARPAPRLRRGRWPGIRAILLGGLAAACAPAGLEAQQHVAMSSLTALYEEAGTAYRDGSPDQLRRALVLYRRYLDSARALGNERKQATGMNGIGNVYRELDQPDSALHYLSSSLAISRSIGHQFNAAMTSLNIGKVYERIGQPDSARAYYERGERMTGRENPNLLARIRLALSRLAGAS